MEKNLEFRKLKTRESKEFIQNQTRHQTKGSTIAIEIELSERECSTLQYVLF